MAAGLVRMRRAQQERLRCWLWWKGKEHDDDDEQVPAGMSRAHEIVNGNQWFCMLAGLSCAC